MRYAANTQALLLRAAGKARAFGHSYVGSMHLLLAIAEEQNMAGRFLHIAGLDVGRTEQTAKLLYGTGTAGLPLPQGFSAQMQTILKMAKLEAQNMGAAQINSMHVLLAVLRVEESDAQKLLLFGNVDSEELFTRVVDYMKQESKKPLKGKKEATATRLLEQFSEDLVLKAADMEPVIGREREIETVIGILSRKNKNNPALIGEPGVGKTAIAEGLAQRMAAGNVPPQLKDKRLISLNMETVLLTEFLLHSIRKKSESWLDSCRILCQCTTTFLFGNT